MNPARMKKFLCATLLAAFCFLLLAASPDAKLTKPQYDAKGSLVRPADYRPRPDSAAYERYVNAMHAWASALDILPEVIEYYFWDEADKSGSPLWSTCQVQHAQHYP